MITAHPRRAAAVAPGYFAMVMATGVLAIGAELQGLRRLAVGLLLLAAVTHGVLVIANVWRVLAHRRSVVADLLSHSQGFAFLTFVAGTNVLGAAVGVVADEWGIARVLWWIGVVGWVALLTPTMIAVVLRSPKPGLAAGINGTWFLMTVSTQSVAVLAALLLMRSPDDLLAFGALAAFGLGVVLYLIVMTMVFLRWTFHELEPDEADPPAWIAAGAVAITVLAGSNLLLAREVSERVERVAPFVEGVVIAAWATATFWFPLMVAIGVWRHLVRGMPLRYHPSYWALVFPLGMYSVSTHRMRDAIDLEALGWLAPVTFVAAMVAWTATAVGLAYRLWSATRRTA